MSRPISRAEDRPSGFQPLSAPRSLTQQLFTRLAADITSGKLPAGSRLPTEQEMIAATGVSRTVVREAVAHLRAEGLVLTRQGVGAFVAENVRRPFRIDFDESSSLREVLNVMELRTGMEIEAAGLAADRASAAGVKKITESYEAIDAAIERGENAVDQDFAFHCAIADATGNPQFRRFLEYLGRFIIPRQTIWGRSAPGVETHPSRHVPEGAPADPASHPRPRRDQGAGRDARASAQQPPQASKARGRTRRQVTAVHFRILSYPAQRAV